MENKESVTERPRRKRLLFLLSRFLDGGIDTVLIEYLRYIVKQNDYVVTLAIGIYMGDLEVFLDMLPKEVKVCYLNKSSILTRYPAMRVKGTISKHMKIFDEIALNPVRRYQIKKGLARLCAANDVVIDFACSFSSFMKPINKPKIGFYHFSLPPDIAVNSHLKKKIFKSMKRYDKIVTISRAMENQFKENLPELAYKVVMIYNAKNLDELKEKAYRKSSRPIAQPYLLAIERLEESQKDVSTLIRAMKILKEQHHFTLPLYILGKGKSEHQLKQLAHSLGVDDMVKFMGFTSNPFPWLKNCAMLLHSAKFEGLPTALIEALLLDKFIVCSDCPTGPKEILDHGRSGILVKPGDAQAFADAVVRLQTDEALQKSILQGIANHKHVFTFDDTYRLFREIIE